MSKEKTALYNADLDAAFAAWCKANPNADHEQQRQWTFKGYEAWDAGYKAAMRALGKTGEQK